MSEPFIGMGHSPDGIDIPTGLGMNLAQDPKAMEAFGQLSRQQKSNLINQIRGAGTGADVKNKIAEAIHQLHDQGPSAF